mgnify:CR=1 FL=1
MSKMILTLKLKVKNNSIMQRAYNALYIHKKMKKVKNKVKYKLLDNRSF